MSNEKGVFKSLKGVNLEEGSKAIVVVKTKGMTDILEKFSRKVDKDVLKEFLEERR